MDEKCHCGADIYYDESGYTRMMCWECSIYRCDVPDENFPRRNCESVE